MAAGAPAAKCIPDFSHWADQTLDGAYWRGHAREPVQFAESIEALAEAGVEVLLELGPRPVLGPMALGAWPASATPQLLCALRPERAADRPFLESMAKLYAGIGLRYGPMLEAVQVTWVGEGKALSRIQAPAALASQLGGEPIHPVLIDACTRLSTELWDLDEESGVFWAPWRVQGMTLDRATPAFF